MAKHVTIIKFEQITGYSQAAIRSKIRDGIWPQGLWVRAPDGRILINVEEYDLWVESGGVYQKPLNLVSKSRSNTVASAAARKSLSSPPPLI